jgi:catechol 2,3-dioxygenase-like lactoylglutathione lyase family enzyme
MSRRTADRASWLGSAVDSGAEGVIVVKVERVVPILNVSDVEASVAWFAKLGWSKQFAWRADHAARAADFGSVACNGYEIFLCRDGQGGRGRGTNARTGGPGADQRAGSGAWVSLWVEDVDAAHARCLAEGLEVTHAPTDEPWGVREMHVRHPDGHVFRIGREID